MTIFELLKGLSIRHKNGPLEAEIKGIAYDSRSVDKGFLFVAIKGFSVDGHDYIEDAIDKGAIAVVTEEAAGVKEDLFVQRGVAHIVVSDSRKALAQISSSFYGRPSDSLTLVGITGTNGKTTTSYVTKGILDAAGKKAGLIGTIHYIIGDRVLKAPHTTPESLDLQMYLREMLDNEIEYTILEVSSHALELYRVEGCSFKVAAFTNFSQDHLDFHGTMDEYFRAKSRLFTYLVEGGKAVLNQDDPAVRSLTEKLDCDVITCGLGEGAMIRAINIRSQDRDGLTFDVITPEGQFALRSRLVSRFNVYNILMSVGIAHALGIDQEAIQRGILETGPVSGRFERIEEGQDFLCIVDYAHTEDALRKLIEEARLLTRGRVITVFGCGGDRDRTKRPIMGEVATELSDFVIITSDNPRSEDPLDIIREILKGIRRDNYSLFVDRAEAIREAVSMAQKGDTLLIAGKGHEDYQEISGVRYPFSDKEILREAIRSKYKA